MAQIYKIYINETVLIITDSLPNQITDYQLINLSEFDFLKFYDFVKVLESPKIFLLLSPQFKYIFKSIKHSLLFIKAAGGIVKNDLNQVLFIFRNGKWDLPKGKMERGEDSRTAAIREVEEECGIKIDSSGKKIANTYHVYEKDGQLVLKKTAWYSMRADKTVKLIPQIEEGITEVRWLSKSELSMVRDNTYPLIRELTGYVQN